MDHFALGLELFQLNSKSNPIGGRITQQHQAAYDLRINDVSTGTSYSDSYSEQISARPLGHVLCIRGTERHLQNTMEITIQ